MGTDQTPSQIMYAININSGLRNRIEATVRSKWWNDPTADPTQSIPLAPLAWAAATNPTILAFVTGKIVDGDIGTAVGLIVEGDLEFVVFEALKRLDALEVPGVPEV